jgi:RNA polymerase sigma factor (sigma-70 family)
MRQFRLGQMQAKFAPSNQDGGDLAPGLPPRRASLLERLYAEHSGPLNRYISTRFGPGPPEPEEVAQAAFAKLAGEDIAAIDNPRAFLYTIACNIVIDHHRSASRRSAVHRNLLSSEADRLSDLSPERVLIAKEKFAVFEAALKKMPVMRRRIFLMVRVEGQTPADVARRFGVSENAIHQHVSRALADCTAAFDRAERKGWK